MKRSGERILKQSSKAMATTFFLISFQCWISNSRIKKKRLHTRTSLLVSFNHIFISITSFKDTPNSLKTVHNIPVQTSKNNVGFVQFYSRLFSGIWRKHNNWPAMTYYINAHSWSLIMSTQESTLIKECWLQLCIATCRVVLLGNYYRQLHCSIYRHVQQ